MKAYVIGLLDMQSWDWYDEYYQHTSKLIEKHGGRYLASGVKPHVLEGSTNPNAHVILEFPSLEHAKNWYQDPDYKKNDRTKAIRRLFRYFYFSRGLD